MCCSPSVFATPKGMGGLYWIEQGKHILVFGEDELLDKVNQLIFDNELMTDVGKKRER